MRHLDFMPDYTRPRKVANADTLERAIQTGDMFAERKMGRERAKQYVHTQGLILHGLPNKAAVG
jgi:hypothetical protein